MFVLFLSLSGCTFYDSPIGPTFYLISLLTKSGHIAHISVCWLKYTYKIISKQILFCLQNYVSDFLLNIEMA